MELRHLTEQDVPDAARVFVTSLGGTPPKKPERYARYWDVDATLGAWDADGRMLGVAAAFDSEFTVVGGAALPCTAVPSVGVRPDAHGRGVGRALLERQVAEARERGSAMLALNASEVAIYGRFGYGPTSTWWSVQADPRTLAWRSDAPRAAPGSIEELEPERAQELLPPLHARLVGGWGGELARHDGYWHAYFTPREGGSSPTFAIHRGPDGEPDAAVAFSVEQHFDDIGFANRVELRDAFGADHGDALLVRWLLERKLAGRFTAERLDPRSPVKWFLDDPRRLRTTAAEDAVWVRVLDLPRVVGARTTLAADVAPVTVRVVDPMEAANDGTWRMGASEGRATCEPCDDDPELTIGIDLVASLLWGFVGPARLAAAGRVEVHDPAAVARLAELWTTTEPSWCSTGF